MLVDDERLAWLDGRWGTTGDLLELRVPQSITTLLAAPLESLPDERVRPSPAGLGRGHDLPPRSDPRAGRGMAQPRRSSEVSAMLVRRDLIRPDRSLFAGSRRIASGIS